MRTQALRLLIVEDNEDDERLILRAISRVDRSIEVRVVRDGQQALEALCGTGTLAPQPDLVLLDWKLRKVMGAEVLRRLRDADEFKNLKIVAFSSSNEEEDRRQCADLKGTDFVTKPVEYQLFMSVIEGILLEHLPQLKTLRIHSETSQPQVIQHRPDLTARAHVPIAA